MNLACGTTEAMVYIGMEMCKVNSMDAETIYCLPPVYQPNALDFAGRRTGQFPVVKVTTLFLFVFIRIWYFFYLIAVILKSVFMPKLFRIDVLYGLKVL